MHDKSILVTYWGLEVPSNSYSGLNPTSMTIEDLDEGFNPIKFNLHDFWEGYFHIYGQQWLGIAIKAFRVPEYQNHAIQKSAHHALCLMSLEEMR